MDETAVEGRKKVIDTLIGVLGEKHEECLRLRKAAKAGGNNKPPLGTEDEGKGEGTPDKGVEQNETPAQEMHEKTGPEGSADADTWRERYQRLDGAVGDYRDVIKAQEEEIRALKERVEVLESIDRVAMQGRRGLQDQLRAVAGKLSFYDRERLAQEGVTIEDGYG